MSLRLRDGTCPMREVIKAMKTAEDQTLRTSLLREAFYRLTRPLRLALVRSRW